MPIIIPSQLPALTIDKKLPSGLTPNDAKLITDQIVSIDNLMSINIGSVIQSQKNRSFSPRLMNWVEPYVISPYTYSLFYTEVNSNLKVGDRVFIVGGNYDSSKIIETDKWSKGSDGYRVLSIDRCKIVLDTAYTGTQVWSADGFDKYIKIYSPSTQEQFDYYCKQFSGSDTSSGNRKFDPCHANIIYASQNFSGNLDTFGYNTGIPYSGFWILDGSGNWTDVTSFFTGNTFSTSDVLSSNFTTNGKLWIVDDFTFSGQDFLKSRTYTYINGNWAVDVDFRPVISKVNFRGGNFKSGEFNGGIYGQEQTQLSYVGDSIKWNTGTLFNSVWTSGEMKSTVYEIDSYETELDIDGFPYQKSIPKNNDGWGYNYIIDSNFLTTTIGYGNFFNTTFGTSSSIDPVMSNYLKGITGSWSKTLTTGSFESCYIVDCLVENSELKFCKVINSEVRGTKSINSSIKDSTFLDNGIFTTNDNISILGYDMHQIGVDSFGEASPLGATAYTFYKFYISDTDYQLFSTFDNFYLSGVSVNSPSQSMISYFDKRWILNSYYDSDDYLNKIDYTVQLSSSLDNQSSIFGSDTLPNRSSIDIITSVDMGSMGMSASVDISKAFIWNSNFHSGIFDGSNWLNGNLINLTYDNHILSNPTASPSGNHFIDIISATQISILVGTASQIKDYVKIGDPIFINAINYFDGATNYNLYSDYIVDDIQDYNYNTRKLIISEILTGTQTSIISTLPLFGTFNVLGVNMNNNWINRVKITNSTINSGLFRRQFIEKTKFAPNGIFNSTDIDMLNLSNLKSLILSDMLVSNNGNDIRSGLFYNSVLLSGSDVWNDGFFYNSYWNGENITQNGVSLRTAVPFNGGTFRESEWVNGVMNGGYFYKNISNATGSTLFTNTTINEYFLTDNIRYSWINGVMNGGTFSKSNWEDGIFNGGNIYNANFFRGTMSGGQFGNKTVPFKNTQMWSGDITGGVVDNGYLYAQDPTFTNIATWSIDWKNGLFRNGQFGNYTASDKTSAIWENGEFSGGDFIDWATWKTGTFSGGKFLSTKGWTNSNSTNQSDYTWMDGQFTGGYFGNAQAKENSTWYIGQFNGGHFQGKVWNDGVFTSGFFEGSGAGTSAAFDPQNFIENAGYLTHSYYGLWRNGIVSDSKDKFITNEKLWTTLQRNLTRKKITPQAELNNMIWLTGTFSHPNGEINNSVWLDGNFESGYFYNSSFNPYVTRPTSGNFEVLGATGFNWDTSCVWTNGELEESSIYLSEWTNGRFVSGTAWGINWVDGIADYINAYNIIWNDGLWKNGNWNSSPFGQQDVNHLTRVVNKSSVSSGFAHDLIVKTALFEGDVNIHINNAFTASGATGSSYSVDNNTLVDSVKIISVFPLEFEVRIPDGTQIVGTSSSGATVSIDFGNGKFKSGIWQNGVWQNGWRQDDTVIGFDSIYKSYKLDPNTWRIFMSTATYSVPGATPSLSSGDNILIGNLVAIDINENRRLISNYQRVVDVSYNSTLGLTGSYILSVDIQTNFPIRRFEIDSSNHIIYVTKNVWLNGLFLNGKFNNGVWGNGLFKGKPFITEMVDSHWIDGTFDGGHLQGLTSSYINRNLSESVYNTSVVQKFVFYDNNISTPYDFKYNSWIDLNYFTYSGVNINKPNKVYKETPIGFTSSYTENNLYGYPTMDVLESVSFIRDGYSSAIQTYKLGWKYKTYTDYVSPFGAPDFTDVVNSAGDPGVETFIDAGWTYSHVPFGATPATSIAVYQSNYADLESGKLYISSTYSSRTPPPTPSDIYWFKVDSLENINTLEIPKGRYSVIETVVESLTHASIPSATTSQTLLFFNNYPATYSIPYTPILFSDRIISAPVNMLWNSEPVKREYFFNKPSLQMEILSGNTYSLAFDRISFIETDMIPFMQIMSDNFGRFRYLNWEEDDNNWEDEISFWENVYEIESGGPDNTNINHDVQSPFFAIAPVVNYSDPNFNYLSAIVVGIDTLNNLVS